MQTTEQQQLLAHAERQTKALESLRGIAQVFLWVFLAAVFFGAVVWYVGAVS